MRRAPARIVSLAPGLSLSVGLALSLASPSAHADATTDTLTEPSGPRDVKTEVPITAFAYSATGAPAKTLGAYGYGLGLAGSGQRFSAGGGVTAWGSPIDRLTLVADALRDVYLLDHFAPSFAAVVRLLGRADDGFSLGALAKYKVEGFGTDANGDLESEIEGGLLLSYVHRQLHVDVNTITGVGLTEDGEIDTEARLRLGYDVGPLVRVGVDGQGRWRLAGTKNPPGNRTWDFGGGPQVVVGGKSFFGSLTTGPTTMGLTTPDIVGWTVMASVGGAL
jgi:hypothetical protein